MTRPPLVAVLLALGACSPRGGDAAAIPDPTPCLVAIIATCAQTGNLLIGSQPLPAALKALADQGYKIVVSTRGAHELNWDERATVESLGMTFVEIPMANPVMAITDQEVAELDAVLRQGQRTVLHCASANRSAGLWGVWLVERRGVKRGEALRLATIAGMRGVRAAVEYRLR
jgi:protein tyrosine phosphatase (PTP) superfamily phosphohydrolase (DUF442 family)